MAVVGLVGYNNKVQTVEKDCLCFEFEFCDYQ